MTTEERIATLEAQVAALSVTPQSETVDYYTSKYSGEEIDALLDYVASIKPSS